MAGRYKNRKKEQMTKFKKRWTVKCMNYKKNEELK
jgi:hypothetical protein